MTDGPVDPLTTLAGAAVGVHELLISLIAAGFTRPEALELVKAVMIGGMRP
jgi:hypothetical protein